MIPTNPPVPLHSLHHQQYTEEVSASFDNDDARLHPKDESTQALSPVSLAEPLPVIVSVASASGKKSKRLSHGSLVVGAGQEADIIVSDAAVSRSHLKISLSPRGVDVVDLESRNGTYYLGQRVGAMTLSLGASLTIGESEISFAADQEDFEGTHSRSVTEYGGLYGTAPPMQHLFALMRRLEGSLVNVLIEGESGTGKELIARALHENSIQKNGPFIALNCGALDRALVRSELFGHKKGAFTGAQYDSPGAFAEAEGGTLFLDEIGELPLDIQPVLLRVLESGSYCRVGETRARPSKVRVITATHRSLKDDVKEKLFRADLYFRLMVVRLHAPSLAERRSDIPLLIEKITRREGLTLPAQAVIDELCRRSFPGNVRELKHALLSYSAVGELPDSSDSLATQDCDGISQFADPSRPYAEQKEALVDRMTYLYLKELISRTGGNRSEAARVAGLQRGYLRRLLVKYGLVGDEDDSPE